MSLWSPLVLHLLIDAQASVDLYASNEPQKAFHRRIAFCLDLYNDAVKVRSSSKPAGSPQGLQQQPCKPVARARFLIPRSGDAVPWQH